MYVYDIEITTETQNAAGSKADRITRLAQYCPTNTDVSMWCKRMVKLIFETTGNKFTVPGTDYVLDIDGLKGIRIAFST